MDYNRSKNVMKRVLEGWQVKKPEGYVNIGERIPDIECWMKHNPPPNSRNVLTQYFQDIFWLVSTNTTRSFEPLPDREVLRTRGSLGGKEFKAHYYPSFIIHYYSSFQLNRIFEFFSREFKLLEVLVGITKNISCKYSKVVFEI